MAKKTAGGTPPLDSEGMTRKLISLTMQQAEKELRDQTASSQVMTHFLRLASLREEAEVEKLKLQNKLLEERIENERAAQRTEEMHEKVLEALTRYVPPRYD